MRLRIHLLAIPLLALACAGCLQQNSAKVVTSAADLVTSAEDLLKLLKSIHDSPSATAATPQLPDAYERLYKLILELNEIGKAADSRGGVTKDAAKVLKDQMAKFQSTMVEVAAENERLQKIHGLPLEFWNATRASSIKNAAAIMELASGQFPEESRRYIRSVVPLLEKYGPVKTVLIEVDFPTGMSSSGPDEIDSRLKTILGPSGEVVHGVIGSHASFMIAPVEDFEAFVSKIDFADVTDKDAPQRRIALNARSFLAERGGFPADRPTSAGPGELPPTMSRIGPDAVRLEATQRHFGKDRVVQFEVTNWADLGHTSDDLRGAISAITRNMAAFNSKNGKGYVATVEDFDAFCNALDFAEITQRDDETKFIQIRVDRAKLATKAATRGGPPLRPSFGESAAGNDTGPGADPPGADVGATIPEVPKSNDEMPSASDPDYHKKLAEMMMNSTFHQGDAMDALLQVQPADIKDKAVLKEIARNFRELAMKNEGGHNQEKAIQGLVQFGGKFSVPLLIQIMESEKMRVPSELFEGLAKYPDAQGAEAVSKQLGNFFNHTAAAQALREMGPVAEDALLKVAPSNDEDESLAAVKLLGEIGTKKSLPLLNKAAKSKNDKVRDAAKDAVKSIMERSRKPSGAVAK